MDKIELFKNVFGEIKNNIIIVASVIQGKNQGEQILISESTVKWKSESAQVLLECKDKIMQIQKSQVIEYDGQRIFCELISDKSKLVICGAGHVSIPIIKMSKMLGFSVTVLEDRPLFANHAREAGADEVICESFEEGLKQIESNKNTYFVIVTRGHRYDTDCLRNIITKSYAYVGMMGSRRRVGIIMNKLEEEGVSKELIDTIHSPIGLSIAAETPEEIAISIIAEIVEVKNRHKLNVGYDKEMQSYLIGEEYKEMVLATIISRRGSAPRNIGTKMLILNNGIFIGTIGGGCFESRVIQKGKQMLNHIDNTNYQLITVDMTEDEAENEGMVCGGVIEVFLERLIYNSIFPVDISK